MGVSASIVAAAATVYSTYNSMEARKDAEKQAAQQRESLAALQAKPAPVIPLPDDKAVQGARRRSIAGMLQSGGRASTILTNQDSGGNALGA